MKRLKKVIIMPLVAALLMGSVVVANPTDAKAEVVKKVTYNKNIRCGVGLKYYGAANIRMPKGYKVKNLKKVTKGLSVTKTSTYNGSEYSRVGYSVYTKKAGKYKLSFDVYNAKGKKVYKKARVVTVYASGMGTIIKSVKMNKKNVFTASNGSSYYTTAKSAKMKFALAKGCKIKKIEYKYYGKNGKEVTKKFKNGKKMNFNNAYADGYSYKGTTYNSAYKSYFTTIRVEITYRDSFDTSTKENQTTSYYVYKKATKWAEHTY